MEQGHKRPYGAAELAAVFLLSAAACALLTWLRFGALDARSVDGDLYLNVARNILAGKGPVNTLRRDGIVVPPGLPLLFAGALGLGGGAWAATALQYAFFGAGSAMLYALCGLIHGRRAASVAAALLYVSNFLVNEYGPRYLLTETPFTCLLLASLLLAVPLWRGRAEAGRSGRLAGLCALASAGALVRPHLLIVLAAALAFAAWQCARRRLKPLALAACVAVPVALFAGNAACNAVFYGRPVLLENYSGFNLYIANNARSGVEFYQSADRDRLVEPLYFTLPENGTAYTDKNEALKKEALAYIAGHPLETLGRALAKAWRLYASNGAAFWYFVAAALGAAATFAFRPQGRGALAIVLGILAALAAATSMGLIVLRYLAPAIPLYCACAAGLTCAAERLPGLLRRRPGAKKEAARDKIIQT